MPRVKGFFGAPIARDLRWDESSLHNEFQPSYSVLKDVLEGSFFSSTNHPQLDTKPSSTAKWRIVPTNPDIQLHTGDTQSTSFFEDHDSSISDPAAGREGISLPNIATSFASTVSSNESDVPVSPSYIRYSFRLHERMTAKHLTQTQPSFISAPSFTSFADTTLDTTLFPSTSTLPVLQLPPGLSHSPLSTLPSAARLAALQPQTPTATLLVAILSVTIRPIAIKRRPSKHSKRTTVFETERHLVDLLVADQSRAGFKCTFWLPPEISPSTGGVTTGPRTSALDIPLADLCSLRRGSIVLIRCIALSSYDGVVYGQSLNPYLTKMKSTVDLLVDAEGGERADVLGEQWRERLQDVKEWVETYVGVTGRKRKAKDENDRGKDKGKARRIEEDLPPDDSMM